MNNYTVSIYNKATSEHITDYNIEEDTHTMARLWGQGKFRREYNHMKNTEITAKVIKSNRKIITVQSPQLWDFNL